VGHVSLVATRFVTGAFPHKPGVTFWLGSQLVPGRTGSTAGYRPSSRAVEAEQTKPWAHRENGACGDSGDRGFAVSDRPLERSTMSVGIDGETKGNAFFLKNARVTAYGLV